MPVCLPANRGKSLVGVWAHNMTEGGGGSGGWHRWPVLHQSVEAADLSVSARMQPGPRNDAMTFAEADSFFIFGGWGQLDSVCD
eukprot:COSAG06_NODE_50620_length_317_cov_1.087156_1_plen_83_part_10